MDETPPFPLKTTSNPLPYLFICINQQHTCWMVEQPEEASPGSGPEQRVHAVRHPRDGLIPLPLPDQDPALREVGAHHHLEGGSELCCFTAWWGGCAARLALLALLCGEGQARPSRLWAEGGCDQWCEVWGGGHGHTCAAARSGIISGNELELHFEQYSLL